MGTTGSGKTTVSNDRDTVSFTNRRIPHSVCEPGQWFQPARRNLLGILYGGDTICQIRARWRTYRLDDTPGFDDTDRSQADILNQIATFLERR